MALSFQHLPKVELHLHLDCSLSREVVHLLEGGIDQEEYLRRFVAPADAAGLPDYLLRALEGIRLMQTSEQLRLVTFDLFDQLRKDRILYAEIRFAPLEHTQGGLSPWEVVSHVESAMSEAIVHTGVEARLILCTLRHYDAAQSMETAQLARDFQGSLVAGFDIAADEAAHSLDQHLEAFRFVREHGILCTAHAGEARGAESVWETLEKIAPQRIGHGVRSIEDPDLIPTLKQRHIHLEVCPSSNIMTRVFPSFPEHSIDQLFRHGVSLSVNTDGRAISNTTLSEEYQILHRTFGWEEGHFLHCNLNALDAAFADEPTKARLREALVKGYEVDGGR
ncbi:MAG: adenosine deaminase [Haliscomenobacter sp.]|nr:adenosine deaminase [Haliscomenobacter sp.]MBK8656698.1 adenosine deaminase [Haliscomenobacter sp.]MBP9076264.1 adenosine deaminase [Haliscomenobacter sp.]MBP9874487.1 adenosine deaminase [Haliscomenobacter sp.]